LGGGLIPSLEELAARDTYGGSGSETEIAGRKGRLADGFKSGLGFGITPLCYQIDGCLLFGSEQDSAGIRHSGGFCDRAGRDRYSAGNRYRQKTSLDPGRLGRTPNPACISKNNLTPVILWEYPVKSIPKE